MGVKATKANQRVRVAGHLPEVESLRQWRQRWNEEIARRRVASLMEDAQPQTLTEWFEWTGKNEDPPTDFHQLTWSQFPEIRWDEETASYRPVRNRVWRMPLMTPSHDLTWLVPGRLEARVSDAAHALIERQRAAEDAKTLDVWGRALFRANLLGFRFAPADVERALIVAVAGAHVQVDQLPQGAVALLVDGEEFAANPALVHLREHGAEPLLSGRWASAPSEVINLDS